MKGDCPSGETIVETGDGSPGDFVFTITLNGDEVSFFFENYLCNYVKFFLMS